MKRIKKIKNMLKEENQNVSEFNIQGINLGTENLKRKN